MSSPHFSVRLFSSGNSDDFSLFIYIFYDIFTTVYFFLSTKLSVFSGLGISSIHRLSMIRRRERASDPSLVMGVGVGEVVQVLGPLHRCHATAPSAASYSDASGERGRRWDLVSLASTAHDHRRPVTVAEERAPTATHEQLAASMKGAADQPCSSELEAG